jgi:membrane protease YdiL (CAAX protease family)
MSQGQEPVSPLAAGSPPMGIAGTPAAGPLAPGTPPVKSVKPDQNRTVAGAGAAGTPAGTGAWVPPTRKLLTWEIFSVFAVSLGASGLYALIQLIGSLTAPKALGKQQAVLNGSLAPGRPTLDLFLQLTSTLIALAPVVLVLYLIAREGETPSVIGLDTRRPGQDLLRGAALAAVIGGSGLGLYLAAFHLGFNLNVVAENLPNVWWRIPVLILSAVQNGLVEETLVIGYLLRRLDQLGWRPSRAIALSACLRGSYHLYQGFGGFIGNAVMGTIFALCYRRWGRVMPLVIAHTLIDMGAFIGYAELHGHVSWLP